MWFDDFALRVGDSIRRSIEQGLAQSRFGVVVLSRAFFQKDWPQRELNGLFSLEVVGRKVILPVWHEVSVDDVRSYSPILADRLGVSTADGIQHVADRLMAAIQAGGEESKPPSDQNTWPETPRNFILRVVGGRDAGRVFPLGRERVVVGRSSSVDIRFADSAFSRMHFALVWDAAAASWVVEDWGHPNRLSLNGVLVAARSRTTLRIGDEIGLGETVFRYERA